jgi:hypothetical protein
MPRFEEAVASVPAGAPVRFGPDINVIGTTP